MNVPPEPRCDQNAKRRGGSSAGLSARLKESRRNQTMASCTHFRPCIPRGQQPGDGFHLLGVGLKGTYEEVCAGVDGSLHGTSRQTRGILNSAQTLEPPKITEHTENLKYLFFRSFRCLRWVKKRKFLFLTNGQLRRPRSVRVVPAGGVGAARFQRFPDNPLQGR